MHDYNCFLTLTYNDENLPPGDDLRLSDWQTFAKRMRKTHPFRFFHCGEYGETTGRPHYHAAIFGQNFRHDRKVVKQSKTGFNLYQSDTLDQMWRLGNAWIGELTFESAAYVARYVMKKVTGPGADEHYEGRRPEYTTMSRRPGIGATWIQQYKTDVYPRDEVITNGKKCRPPIFYDRYLEKVDPEAFKQLKSTRHMEGLKHTDNNTPDRLEVREICHHEKIKQLTREL